MKKLLFVVLALLSSAAFAQTPPTKFCVSALCTVLMDWTVAAAPNNGIATQCRLREGATILETRAIGASGVGACTFTPRNFTAGSHTISGTVLDAGGIESTSISTTFISAVTPAGPPGPPTNIRLIP